MIFGGFPAFLQVDRGLGHEERQITEQVSFAPAAAALQQQEYDKILVDKNLFWAIFCKTITEGGSVLKPEYGLNFKRAGSLVEITGNRYPLDEMKNAAEAMRKIFEKAAAEKRNFILLPVKGSVIYFKEPSPLRIKAKGEGGIVKGRYLAFIEPAMTALVNAFGASCEKTKVIQQIKDIVSTCKKEVEGWSIKWNSDERYVYPIAPCQAHEGPDMRKELYGLFKDKAQPFCDYSLVASDGTALKVHGVVLAIYGGDVFKAAMTNNMTETANKATTIPDASPQSLAHLIEYLYRGPKALTPENLRGQEIDITSMFAIGHRYQVPGLVDSCTNVLLATSSIEDIDSIMDLAATYKNTKLAEFGLHLIKQANLPSKTQEVQFQSAPLSHEPDKLYDVD